MRFTIPALLVFLQATSAFYPYFKDEQQTSHQSPRAILPPQDLADNGLRATIRKLPAKRTNNFNIIPASSPTQENSLGVDQDGSDYSYFSAFKFGTSDKVFYMLLDSAASNTWVMSSDCKSSACGVHNLLGTGDSSSLKVVQESFSVTYGTGSVQGIRGSDTAHLGSISVPLTFGLATNVSNEFTTFPMDGILGLGRPENLVDKSGDVGAPSLMDVLITAKIITAKMFGLDLWRASDGGTNSGELNFGMPDSSRYSGELNYIAAMNNTDGFWEIPVDGASVNGDNAGLSGRTAIIDSGTSYILVPYDDAVQLHELIPNYKTAGTETFIVPCDSTASVQLTFGGVTYGISPKDYVGRQTTGGCSSNIVGRQTFGPKQWLVGDVFLKNVYTLFDYDGQRVGFGIKKSSSSDAAATASGSGTISATATSSHEVSTLHETASSSGAASSRSTNSPAASSSAAPGSTLRFYTSVGNWAIFAFVGFLFLTSL
ncbi:hypothetical protein, variant [Verruconis gallopava]|uniref:Peptidase A1 domain-containing protein n=1 Tax=Verruconis gallopava TaxID=253628 RepID=A0A0D2AFY6_9PEZI|nr:hypothetical protein, variant [Verruconis gallopava]KIW05415.1 hypothetical protein, variant [Verruconis gallopava]